MLFQNKRKRSSGVVHQEREGFIVRLAKKFQKWSANINRKEALRTKCREQEGARREHHGAVEGRSRWEPELAALYPAIAGHLFHLSVAG